MNTERRKRIIGAMDAINRVISEIESIRDDEQAAFDAIPESLQGSERAQQSEAAISGLEDAISDAENARETLNAIQ